MTKIVILGDTHLGARNGSPIFSTYFNRFFSEVLFPFMEKEGIRHVIQTGDLFDSRSALNYKSYHASKDVWFGEMERRGISLTTILGNHDIHYKNTLRINSPSLLLKEFKNINVIDSPTTISFDGFDVDLIPWVCDENETEVLDFVTRKDRSSMLIGHLELAGFPMYKGGAEFQHGMSPDKFDFPWVISGHFHTKSEKGNVQYTGTPYEITWSDFGDQKGFFVFDTTKKTLDFVPNPFKLFRKIVYNNGSSFDIKSLKDCYVKLIVQSKVDLIAFDQFVTDINLQGPIELTIIENNTSFESEEAEEQLEEKDTLSFVNNVIDGMTTDVNKEQLKTYLNSLYHEALHL